MGTKLPFPVGRQTHRALDPARPRTAFVLSGGGNQGVSQVGMLRALLEHDIVPDVVIGTSAGALNGAAVAYAPNLTGIAQLAAVWEQLQTDHVFPGGRIHRAWNIVRRGTHLFGNEGLAALIHHSTPARSFSDLEIPLRVVATDLDTGEEVVLARGPLKPALLASAALPGVFPIVVHGGRRLVDGGVVNNVPLWHALSGPVDRVFVLNVSSGAGEHAVRSPLDVVMTSFMHARNQRYELERRQAIDRVDIIDLPRPRDPRELFDFSGARELIDDAYRLSMDRLDRYERDLARSTRTPRPPRPRTRPSCASNGAGSGSGAAPERRLRHRSRHRASGVFDSGRMAPATGPDQRRAETGDRDPGRQGLQLREWPERGAGPRKARDGKGRGHAEVPAATASADRVGAGPHCRSEGHRGGELPAGIDRRRHRANARELRDAAERVRRQRDGVARRAVRRADRGVAGQGHDPRGRNGRRGDHDRGGPRRQRGEGHECEREHGPGRGEHPTHLGPPRGRRQPTARSP